MSNRFEEWLEELKGDAWREDYVLLSRILKKHRELCKPTISKEQLEKMAKYIYVHIVGNIKDHSDFWGASIKQAIYIKHAEALCKAAGIEVRG